MSRIDRLPPEYAAHAALVLDAIRTGARIEVAPPARWATRRDPRNPTMGGAAAVLSAALGEPFMPWQRQVADVALELDRDRPGAWRYQKVIVSVSRQSGKSTLMRAVRATKAIMQKDRLLLMTAQTGKDAKKQWNKLLTRSTAKGSPLVNALEIRKSQGSEALTFRNGSVISPFAPTPKSIHGDTVHHVDVDEVWSFGRDDGDALVEAIDPTQITVFDRQSWWLSTKGTHLSALLNDLIEEGRAAVVDPTTTTAYFEWSCPDNVDYFAPETVASFHPAVGLTQALPDIMAKAKGPRGTWFRAYLNRDQGGGSASTIVDLDDLAALSPSTLAPLPAGSELTLAYAVADDRSGACIWAAWLIDGQPHAQLVASGPGQSWLSTTLAILSRSLQPRIIAEGAAGFTRNTTKELTQAGITVERPTPAEYAEACTGFIGRVMDGTVTHGYKAADETDPHPDASAAARGTTALHDAFQAAVLAPMAGSRGIDARKSSGPVDHAQAAVVAVHYALNAPALQLY